MKLGGGKGLRGREVLENELKEGFAGRAGALRERLGVGEVVGGRGGGWDMIVVEDSGVDFDKLPRVFAATCAERFGAACVRGMSRALGMDAGPGADAGADAADKARVDVVDTGREVEGLGDGEGIDFVVAKADFDAGILGDDGFALDMVMVVDLGVVGFEVLEEEDLVTVDDVACAFLMVTAAVKELGAVADKIALMTAVPDLEGGTMAAAGLVDTGFAAVFELAGFVGAVLESVAETVLVLAIDLAEFDLATVVDRAGCELEIVFAAAGAAGFAARGFAVMDLGLGIFDGILEDFDDDVTVSDLEGDLRAFSSQNVARGLRWSRGASEPAVNATGDL